MKETRAVERLTPGTVLDDTDPAVQTLILEVYRNTPVHLPGMFHKVREVRRISIGPKYVRITMESFGIVRRPRGFEVGVL